MKKLKLFSLIMAFAMMFTMVLPLGKASAIQEEQYDVVVHKVLFKKGNEVVTRQSGAVGADGQTIYTGKKFEPTEFGKYFGSGVETEPVKGVHYVVTGENGFKEEKVTDETGTVTFSLKKGTYKIEEDLSKTKLEGAYEKSIPTKSVPVTVTLPVFKAEGGTFTTGQDALHVYPKNSVDEPTIVKSVTQSGNMNDTAGVGEIKQFIIESVMPEEIEAYKVLTYVDKLSQGLTYKENLVVKKIAKGSSDAQVVESSNYTTNVVGTKGAKITIAFKPEFISTLRAGDKLVITYDSIINTDAVMGKSNPNEVELEYGRASDNTKKKKPENPELHTGGKKFVKKSATDDSVLQNAEFIVKRTEDNKYVKVDGDVVSFVGTEDEATKFKSDKQGIIDIKGLPYGKMGDANDGSKSTEYKLIEKVAPEGYALDSSEHKFNVSKTSYYENPDAIELKPVDPEKILNNKVTIPQTGGIGSVVVVAAGIAIVGLGLYLKRKNSRA